MGAEGRVGTLTETMSRQKAMAELKRLNEDTLRFLAEQEKRMQRWRRR